MIFLSNIADMQSHTVVVQYMLFIACFSFSPLSYYYASFSVKCK